MTAELQVARVPASRTPTAQAVPYGVTDSRRISISIVMTPLCSLLTLLPTIITVCLPHGGDFLVMKMEDLFLLRNTLITRLSSEESAFVLA